MKKLIIVFFGLGIVIIATYCSEKEKADNNIKTIRSISSPDTFRDKLFNKKLMDSLIDRAINKGDTLAYNQIKGIYYIAEQKFSGFLYYSMIMSNKFNYKTASFDVYDILTHGECDTLDEVSKKIANEYFLKSKK